MTEFNDAADAGAALPMGVGDRLRAAREAAGMSCADIAQALKFSQRQIEMIEANAWSELPGQTFVRGFVRNYARVVNLDPQPLLKELETAALPKASVLDLPRSTEATLPQQGGVQKKDYATVFGALALVLVAVAAYFFVPDDLWSDELAKIRAALLAPVESTTAGSTAPVKDLMPPPAAGQAAADPSTPAAADASAQAAASTPLPAEAAAAPGAAATGQAPPTAAGGPLRFEFDKASWVEVRDGKGAIVMSRQGTAGSAHDIEGDPPFSIIIGDGRSVRLTYRDHPIDLGPFINAQSNVARLTIE